MREKFKEIVKKEVKNVLLEKVQKDELEFTDGEEDLVKYLEKENAFYDRTNLNGYRFYIVNDEYVVEFPEGSDYPEAYKLEEFLNNVVHRNRFYDVTGIDYKEYFSNNFWENVGTVNRYNVLFHGTNQENVDEILSNGLETRRETHSLTNKHIRGVVFAVMDVNPLLKGTYGDAIIEIDTVKMKQDGFAPDVSREPEVEDYYKKKLLAKKVGIDMNLVDIRMGSTRSVWKSTIMIHSDIPPKYLSIRE